MQSIGVVYIFIPKSISVDCDDWKRKRLHVSLSQNEIQCKIQSPSCGFNASLSSLFFPKSVSQFLRAPVLLSTGRRL